MRAVALDGGWVSKREEFGGLDRGTLIFLARQLSQASLTVFLFGGSLVCLGNFGIAAGSSLSEGFGSKRRSAAMLSAFLLRRRHKKFVGNVFAARSGLSDKKGS